MLKRFLNECHSKIFSEIENVSYPKILEKWSSFIVKTVFCITFAWVIFHYFFMFNLNWHFNYDLTLSQAEFTYFLTKHGTVQCKIHFIRNTRTIGPFSPLTKIKFWGTAEKYIRMSYIHYAYINNRLTFYTFIYGWKSKLPSLDNLTNSVLF